MWESAPKINIVSGVQQTVLRVPLQSAYILIATDVPQVLDPVKTEVHTLQTRIDWAVNGHLGHHCHDSQASGFFAKADLQLQRPVEDFSNSRNVLETIPELERSKDIKNIYARKDE